MLNIVSVESSKHHLGEPASHNSGSLNPSSSIYSKHSGNSFKRDPDPNFEYQSIDQEVYYKFGVIDFLQNYNTMKSLETKWRRFLNPTEKVDAFSCVNPKTYGERFYLFMKENLFAE